MRTSALPPAHGCPCSMAVSFALEEHPDQITDVTRKFLVRILSGPPRP